MKKNKLFTNKSMLCAILASSILAINVQPTFAMNESIQSNSTNTVASSIGSTCLNLGRQAVWAGLTALSHGSRHAIKNWKALDKKAPFLTEAIVGVFVTATLVTILKEIKKEGIETFIPEKMHWMFGLDSLSKMPELKNSKISFSNRKDFAPGSIDTFIQKIIESIRIKRSGLIKDKKIIDEIIIPKLILARGESQIGKTHSLEGLAHELGCKNHFCFASTELKQKYYGKVEEQIKKIFKYAKKKSSKAQPFVIVLDEIDGLVDPDDKHSKGSAQTLHELILNISENKEGYENVYLFATTNHYDKIPATIQNRFKNDNGTYEHQMPNEKAREAILNQQANKLKLKLDSKLMKKLVEDTDKKCIPEIKSCVTIIKDQLTAKKIEQYLAPENKNLDELLQLDKDINTVMSEQTIFGKLKKGLFAPFVICKSCISYASKKCGLFKSEEDSYETAVLQEQPVIIKRINQDQLIELQEEVYTNNTENGFTID